jgi:HEAT repeat protein
MKKLTYYLFFVIPLIFTNCGSKPNPQVSDNNENIILIQDPYTMDDLLKIKSKFNSDLPEATDELIGIYRDKNQILEVRLEALEILSTNQDSPVLKTALKETIENTEFIEFEIIKKSIEMLLKFNNLNATDTFVDGLQNSISKTMELRADFIEAIGENHTKDKIITLLDLYEISKKDYQRMNELLTLSLGELDDDRSIPLLMEIANDDDIELHVRNRAIEILSRKNAPELVDFFIERLGSPKSNDQMLEFIHNSMGIVDQDRLVMALLESYQTGKTRYHAMLHSIMGSLEDYNSPDVKPVFVEVATTEGFPRLIRIKAIQSLANFNDVTVLDDLIPILENSNNHDYYYELTNLANALNADSNYKQKIKEASFKAMQSK